VRNQWRVLSKFVVLFSKLRLVLWCGDALRILHGLTVFAPDNLNVRYKYKTMKIKNQLLSTMLLLSCLILSSCSDKKADTNDKQENPFGSTSNTETRILQPCHWTFTVEQSVNGEAMLLSTAKVDSGWHLYSQHVRGNGPATEFAYDSLHTYELIGETEEGETIKKYDPNLEMEVVYFEKDAAFKQKIKVVSKKDFTITGAVDYMVCLDHGQCIHSNEDFAFKVTGKSSESN
jgi:hypothetical protein